MGGGVGVGVGLPDGSGEPGAGDAPSGRAVGLADGMGVTGGFVAVGAGGFTCARKPATDARMHPVRTAPANNEARALTRERPLSRLGSR